MALACASCASTYGWGVYTLSLPESKSNRAGHVVVCEQVLPSLEYAHGCDPTNPQYRDNILTVCKDILAGPIHPQRKKSLKSMRTYYQQVAASDSKTSSAATSHVAYELGRFIGGVIRKK